MNNVSERGKLQLLPMNNSELKNIITNWFIEEGVSYSEHPDEDTEFKLEVKWGYTLDIFKEKGRRRLKIIAGMNLPKKTSKKHLIN